MNPILTAIDTTDLTKARQLAAQLKGQVGGIKLGLEFFSANGAAGVRAVEEVGMPVFLDLKFHDIPNTVAGAVRASLAQMSPSIMTVHTAGGKAMMQAAAEAAKAAKKKPIVVGVTVLTSLDQNDLASIGVEGAIADQAKRLAALAQESGLDGVVCSPHEIEALRAQCGKEFALVVPGIRPAGSAAGDQKRIMTPKEALALGATYLVIGRPITESADPVAAARIIVESLG